MQRRPVRIHEAGQLLQLAADAGVHLVDVGRESGAIADLHLVASCCTPAPAAAYLVNVTSSRCSARSAPARTWSPSST